MIQEAFNKESVRLLILLKTLNFEEGKKVIKLKSQREFRDKYLGDMIKQAIKELVLLTRNARKRGLNIPNELSYIMIDYIAGNFYNIPQNAIIKGSMKHNMFKDSIHDHNKKIFTINLIISGHKRGCIDKEAGIDNKNPLDFNKYIDGYSRVKLSAEDYGYQLAFHMTKLRVADFIPYFQHTLFVEKNTVSNLLTKYNLRGIILDYINTLKR